MTIICFNLVYEDNDSSIVSHLIVLILSKIYSYIQSSSNSIFTVQFVTRTTEIIQV